jgi:hypothetical protein
MSTRNIFIHMFVCRIGKVNYVCMNIVVQMLRFSYEDNADSYQILNQAIVQWLDVRAFVP